MTLRPDFGSQAGATSGVDRALLFLGFLLLAIAVGQALLLPIYPDEVAYRYFLERFFHTGGVKQSLTPYCAAGFAVAPGPLLWPAAAFWTFIDLLGGTWLSYRLVPVAILATTAAGIGWNGIARGRPAAAIALAVLAFGPGLYGLIILRPEVIILGGGVAVFFIGRTMARANGLPAVLVAGIALVVLQSLVAYIHPKGLYLLLPVLVAIGLGCWRLGGIGRRFVAGLGLGGLALAVALSALGLHSAQFISCPEVPELAAVMTVQSLNPLDLVRDPAGFFAGLGRAFSPDLLAKALAQLEFRPVADAGYLPPIETTGLLEQLANILTKAVLAGLGAFGVYRVAAGLLSSDAHIRMEALVLLATAAALLGPFALNLTRGFYEVSAVIGGVAVVGGLAWALPGRTSVPGGLRVGLRAVAAVFLLGGGLWSQILVLRHYSGPFAAGYEGPSLGARADLAGATARTQDLLARRGPGDLRAAIVDDLTYDALHRLPVLVPITYLGPVLDKPLVLRETLGRLGIGYGITRCGYLPALGAALGAEVLEVSPADPARYDICLYSVNPPAD